MTTSTSSDILVIGATGNTGGATLNALIAQGVPTRVLVRSAEKGAALASDLVTPVVGDLDDQASLVAALSGIRAVYFNVLPVAAMQGQVDRFIAAAKEAGVQHIVKLSGLNARIDSASTLVRLHADADRRLIASGIPTTILGANSFFQNTLGQLDAIKGQGAFYLPLGEARQSLIDVADIGAAAAAVLTDTSAKGGTYALTGPESLSFAEVAAQLATVLDQNVAYVPVGVSDFQGALVGAGWPEEVAFNVAELFGVMAEGAFAPVSGDVEALTGRAPRRHIDWLRETLGVAVPA